MLNKKIKARKIRKVLNKLMRIFNIFIVVILTKILSPEIIKKMNSSVLRILNTEKNKLDNLPC